MQTFLSQYNDCLFTSILFHQKWISINLHLERLNLDLKQSKQFNDILKNYVLDLSPTETETLKCLVVKNGDNLESYCLKQEFKLPDPTTVAIVESRRDYKVKTTAWVRKRQYLDELKSKLGVGEIVTCQGDFVYEGLITNFVVVLFVDGEYRLQTASLETVVAGTCLKSLISVCNESNIKIDFNPPDLKNVSMWKGAFLTNAFRWIQPITRLERDTKELVKFDDFDFILELKAKLISYFQRD